MNDVAQALLDMQRIDIDVMQLKHDIDTLPQKQKILDCRAKLKDVTLKRAQIVDLKDEAEQRVDALGNEDKQATERIAEVKKKIDETNDYRVASKSTKEMVGLIKRREKVEFELGNLSERLDKIDALMRKADEGLANLEKAEKKLTLSYQKDGLALKKRIDDLTAQRKEIAATVPASYLERYEHLRSQKGGIAVGKLDGRMCSVCRVEYQEGQLIKVMSEAPIATCPICNRILIVADE